MIPSRETTRPSGIVEAGAQAEQRPTVVASKSIWLRAAVSGAAALTISLILWALAVPIGGLELVASMGGTQPQPVGPLQITIAVLAAVVGASIVSALVGRFARRARRVWLGISIGVGILSLAGPLLSAPGASMFVLVILHVVVGGILIAGLIPPRARPERA